MDRLTRVGAPGQPRHITRRGNHREPVFVSDGDSAADLDLISKAAKASGAEIWVWRLMPNPVHFIMTPGQEDGLRAAFAQAHRQYSAGIHSSPN
ncbi:hypothetical protein [Phenylobacterium sp.]|jgi:putative transposase|uniref:hypothetical protein n=1 Tax=Phenylobacterium sp. TaxID=1871053 RepID=UPI0025F0C071|nr:hypothetical protein [Phenylobacterium sp.]MCA3149571.1 transposase [Rhodocyclaceae bacterium]MCA3159344.1 transposase [Burkholderiales bacterium]MCA3652424.1 transposase [Methylobacterium sp.]MCA6310336.1 transposase [Phenylobacterium sp.]MCA6351693.1 transposase [Phenylobacterium sp.]